MTLHSNCFQIALINYFFLIIVLFMRSEAFMSSTFAVCYLIIRQNRGGGGWEGSGNRNY